MSHFSVTVVSSNEENYEDQLAPYHEFESTSTDDQYVKDVDVTDEYIKDYENSSVSRIKDSDGNLHKTEDDRFYRDPTDEELKKIGPIFGSGIGNDMRWVSKDWGDGRGYRPKIYFVPDGWSEVEVPCKDAMSFLYFCTKYNSNEVLPLGEQPELTRDKHKYGYAVVDGDKVAKIIRRTNPDARWDYHVLGGRYSNRLKHKNGSSTNQCRKKDLDIDALINERISHGMEEYDKFHKVVAGRPVPQFQEILEKNGGDADKARNEYGQIEVIRDLRDSDLFFWQESWDHLKLTRDECVEYWRKRALVTFALIKDGQWHEQGKMGWWACVSDEKGQEDWNDEFMKIFNTIKDDEIITIVDCHI